MSVLIKDMEMPTSCTMCWLNTFCGVWNTEPVKHKGFNERLEGCPLTEQIQCKDCRHAQKSVFKEKYKRCDYNGELKHVEDFCSWAERNPPQVNPEMVRKMKERLEKYKND